jgi:protein tyrosine phosphatase
MQKLINFESYQYIFSKSTVMTHLIPPGKHIELDRIMSMINDPISFISQIHELMNQEQKDAIFYWSQDFANNQHIGLKITRELISVIRERERLEKILQDSLARDRARISEEAKYYAKVEPRQQVYAAAAASAVYAPPSAVYAPLPARMTKYGVKYGVKPPILSFIENLPFFIENAGTSGINATNKLMPDVVPNNTYILRNCSMKDVDEYVIAVTYKVDSKIVNTLICIGNDDTVHLKWDEKIRQDKTIYETHYRTLGDLFSERKFPSPMVPFDQHLLSPEQRTFLGLPLIPVGGVSAYAPPSLPAHPQLSALGAAVAVYPQLPVAPIARPYSFNITTLEQRIASTKVDEEYAEISTETNPNPRLNPVYAAKIYQYADGVPEEEILEKNRYVDILPINDTRVTLQPDNGYINANYINGLSEWTMRKFIATQAPIDNTIIDFWKMVSQQNITFIVMLTDLTEGGRIKAVKYWPDLGEAYDKYTGFSIQCSFQIDLNDIVIREFKIYKNVCNYCPKNATWKCDRPRCGNMCDEHKNNRHPPGTPAAATHILTPIPLETPQTVLHVQWKTWPDRGNPSVQQEKDVDLLISLLSAFQPKPNMTLIHCSAGVGRTGTFIALMALKDYLTTEREKVIDGTLDLNIYNLVQRLRSNRPLMVQSDVQYKFIYQYVVRLVDNIINNRGIFGTKEIKDIRDLILQTRQEQSARHAGRKKSRKSKKSKSKKSKSRNARKNGRVNKKKQKSQKHSKGQK